MIFGHIGDAHVHVNLFSDPDEPERASALLAGISRVKRWRWAARCRRNTGWANGKRTCSSCNMRPEAMEAMRAVKRRLDPRGILGRGTLL